MSASPPHDRSDFHVAIICALKIEADAVYSLLDKDWNDEGHDYGKDKNDTNSYTLGSIGQHNVVIVRLSGMGSIRASTAAGNLNLSFPNITLALVVGVCGGVPTPSNDRSIFLGDLVLSSRVVQYGFGRQYPDRFERKGGPDDSLPEPRASIRNFLGKLDSVRYHRKLLYELDRGLKDLENKGTGVSYPGAERDHLYDPKFVHKHRQPGVCAVCDDEDASGCHVAAKETCQILGCNQDENIIRYGRTIDRHESPIKHIPEVHVGTIGCGDMVIKSAVHRDQLAEQDGVIAFEMEGAGIWDRFASIIVKGVCDYADSHKNKEWQPYAAAVAAVGTKALLSLWTTTTDLTPVAPSDAIARLQAELQYKMMNTREDQIDSQKKGVAPQSFDWVWSTTFRKWLVGSFGSSVPFWIAGKPGSGKSTLMKYLVDNKKTRQLLTKVDKNFSIISFFFDYRAGESTANNCIGVLKMFMKQLCDLNPKLEVNLASENVKTPIGKMSEVRLIKLFAKALRSTIGQTWAFIDGLDEYSGDYTELVLFFQELQSQTPINLCLASRPEAVFQSRFKEYPHFVMQDYNHKSIRAYCTYAIQAAQDQLMNCEALRNPQVREAIVQKAQGVIIRARFAVDTLLHENPHDVSAATLEAFIDRLPEDLEQMYTGTLKRLSQNMASKAALILYLIT